MEYVLFSFFSHNNNTYHHHHNHNNNTCHQLQSNKLHCQVCILMLIGISTNSLAEHRAPVKFTLKASRSICDKTSIVGTHLNAPMLERLNLCALCLQCGSWHITAHIQIEQLDCNVNGVWCTVIDEFPRVQSTSLDIRHLLILHLLFFSSTTTTTILATTTTTTTTIFATTTTSSTGI